MLCTLALGAAACGGPEPADRATANAVTGAVSAYYAALAAGDGERVCALLTESARDDAGEDGVGCAQAAEQTSQAVPDELLAELRDAPSGAVAVEVDGDEATARLTVESAYASRPRKLTIALERVGGRWLVAGAPEADGRTEDDPVTTCFAAGVQAFEEGQADPYWKREGRADFARYLSETCRRAVRRGIVRERAGELTERQRTAFEAVASEVLREMIAAGRVREP